jgi:prevent-host-death family protein
MTARAKTLRSPYQNPIALEIFPLRELSSIIAAQPKGGDELTTRTQYGTLYSEVMNMVTMTASKARAMLYKLLDKVSSAHEPVQITGKRANGVLVSEEDWNAIQETLYLLSIPGMRESIRKGLKEPVSKCAKAVKW